jgi:rod shape-determining protein MreB
VQVIVETIKDAMDEAPPEIVSDLIDSGICLAGGGAQLLGLAERLSDDLNLRVWVAEDPMTCVARGAGMVLEDLEHYKQYFVSLDRRKGL